MGLLALSGPRYAGSAGEGRRVCTRVVYGGGEEEEYSRPRGLSSSSFRPVTRPGELLLSSSSPLNSNVITRPPPLLLLSSSFFPA